MCVGPNMEVVVSAMLAVIGNATCADLADRYVTVLAYVQEVIKVQVSCGVCKQALPRLLIAYFFVDLENHQGQPACVELEITELL